MTDESLSKAQRATALTISNLLTQHENELTQIQIEEIQELASEIGRVLPAGNVVQMVFSQLRTATSRRVANKDSKRIMALLQQGMSTMMDKASYLAFYSTPALLISGYQMLLKAAGKDPDASFAEGVWQFYLEFGLREDTARHSCETYGFHKQLNTLPEPASLSDQLAACLRASSDLLYMYPELLATEWHERRVLHRLGTELNDKRMVNRWLARRPYAVPHAWDWDYIPFRRDEFNQFVRERLMTGLAADAVDKTIHFWDHEETLIDHQRVSYQDQMNLVSQLDPTAYADERIALDLKTSYIAVIWQDHYYLVPLAHHGRRLPPGIIRTMAHSILSNSQDDNKPNVDQLLVKIPRAAQQYARARLPKSVLKELELLRKAPIIVNWDEMPSEMPLSYIRQGRRGVGDHALTIFRTEKSLVFDQSHIFFDATWGMAVAEIFTNMAAKHVRLMPPDTIVPSPNIRPNPLQLMVKQSEIEDIQSYIQPTDEVSEEMTSLVVKEINKLRKLLLARNADFRLTVNDFLVMYRALFNQLYEPSEALQNQLEQFAERGQEEQAMVEDVWQMLLTLRNELPAILIPIDASAIDPRVRLFPITYWARSPWTELFDWHDEVWSLHQRVQKQASEDEWNMFAEKRTNYWQLLKMFGVLMDRYKEIALEGKSFSTVTLKILASVPRSIQEMLRDIPDRIDVLNDLLKGTEVFSNVGRVADTSSLTRFITAKDDNQKKELCWGIMTRADGIMNISLRDFRHPVVRFLQAGHYDMAQHITHDFLTGYVRGLEQFIWELHEISRLRRPE